MMRVSTQKQGESRLGLDAQLAALNHYAELVSGSIVHVYREVESGTDSERPELAKAIAHAKRIRGKLVIAKLDRDHGGRTLQPEALGTSSGEAEERSASETEEEEPAPRTAVHVQGLPVAAPPAQWPVPLARRAGRDVAWHA
jgi:hypothetical protein